MEGDGSFLSYVRRFAFLKDLLVPFLDPVDLCRLSQASHEANAQWSDVRVWRRMYLTLWPLTCARWEGPQQEEEEEEEWEAEFDVPELSSYPAAWTRAKQAWEWKSLCCQRWSCTCMVSRELKRDLFVSALKEEEDDWSTLEHLEVLIKREKARISALTWTCTLPPSVECGVLSCHYQNDSGSGISGICNFLAQCTIALWLPQSPTPLILTLFEEGSGYKDDPTVRGFVIAGPALLFSPFSLTTWTDPWTQRHVVDIVDNERSYLKRHRFALHPVVQPWKRGKPSASMGLMAPPSSPWGIRPPDPTTLLFDLENPSNEHAKANLNELLEGIETSVLNSFHTSYPRASSPARAFVFTIMELLFAVRKLNTKPHISWAAHTVLQTLMKEYI